MVLPNGSEYKTVLLDTNVLHTLATSDDFKRKLFLAFCSRSKPYLFCFSLYNIIELLPKENIRTAIMDFFSHIPCLLFMPYRTILQEEHYAAVSDTTMEINNKVVYAFTPCSKRDPCFSDWITQLILEHENIMAEIQHNISQLPAVAATWQRMRSPQTISPKLLKQLYQTSESGAVSQFIVDCIDVPIHSLSDYTSYPAARTMLYSQTKRVHYTKKPILPNDVMDVEISACAPYVDAIVTESTQAEIYKQGKRIIPQLQHLEIFKISDVINRSEG